MKMYALYRGEELLASGTMYQIAKAVGVKFETIKYYSSPAYRRRTESRKNGKFYKQRCLVVLDD